MTERVQIQNEIQYRRFIARFEKISGQWNNPTGAPFS
jgi:hypothetical protein